jgi:hypothetical protein
MTRWFSILVLGLLVAGCGMRKYAYHTVHPHLASGSAPGAVLAVAVHDERSEVASGNKKPTFVGLLRGGYGNPMDVRTASGAPVAQDLTAAIARSLEEAHYRVRVLNIPHDQKPDQAAAELSASGAHTLLLVRLHTLKCDTYATTGFAYHLEAEVIGAQRRLFGRGELQGKDNLGGSAFGGVRAVKRAVLKAVEEKLSALLNQPQIVEALRMALAS